MHPSSSTTLIKGAIGAVPPYFALIFHFDQWAAPAQIALGSVVPTLVSISLLFDIGKKYRDREEEKRQEKIRQQRHEYLKRHKWKKRRKPANDGGPPDDTLDYVDKL